MAFELNIIAFKHAPWGGSTGLADIVVLGKDWSAATFLWNFGAPDDLVVLMSLDNAAPGSQGVSASYDAGYVHPESGAVVGATTIRPFITEENFESLVFVDVDDLVLAHTFYLTPDAELERVYCHGTFTIKQGVAEA